MARTADEARAQAASADAARAQANAKVAADIAALEKRFGQNGDLSIDQDNYGNFRLVKNENGQTVRVYFVPAPNGVDFSIATEAQVVNLYKKNAAQGGGLEALRKKLYELGFISKPDYTRKDESSLNNAIIDAANAHTMEQVQKYTLNPGQKSYQFTPFSGWLNTKKSGITPDKPPIDTDIQKTNKLNTDQDIDAFVLDMLGRKATPEEKAAYYAKVSEEQAKATRKDTVKGTVRTTTGEFLNEDDYFRIAAAVIEPSIKGTPLADVGKLGGKVAKQIVDLKDYARDYGIRLDSKKALEYVMGGLAPGGSLKTGALDTQKNIIREMSKAFYSNLAPMIDAGVKVADIASQFAQYKGKVLELPDEAIDVFDEDIQTALTNRDATGKQQNGVMNLTDFQIKLRKDPRWSKTSNAREEASSYANSILKSFGLVG
jgi:stress response protein SCP2